MCYNVFNGMTSIPQNNFTQLGSVLTIMLLDDLNYHYWYDHHTDSKGSATELGSDC